MSTAHLLQSIVEVVAVAFVIVLLFNEEEIASAEKRFFKKFLSVLKNR